MTPATATYIRRRTPRGRSICDPSAGAGECRQQLALQRCPCSPTSAEPAAHTGRGRNSGIGPRTEPGRASLAIPRNRNGSWPDFKRQLAASCDRPGTDRQAWRSRPSPPAPYRSHASCMRCQTMQPRHRREELAIEVTKDPRIGCMLGGRLSGRCRRCCLQRFGFRRWWRLGPVGDGSIRRRGDSRL
jgi:hypothetical protein